MPLSLRRPKQTSIPLTPDPQRSVSNPTLLSRLRASTFSRSESSLLSSIAYESVPPRTPPTPCSTSTCIPPRKKLTDVWEKRGFHLTTEQRECLDGAEVLRIWDPLTGEQVLPESYTTDLEEDGGLDNISEIDSSFESNTIIPTAPVTPTPMHDSFDHVSHFLPRHSELTPPTRKPKDISSTHWPNRRRPTTGRGGEFTPYRKITLRSRARLHTACDSPVMVPLRGDSPETTPRTSSKIGAIAPDWTTVSAPQTPLAKMILELL